MILGGGVFALAVLALWIYCILDVIATDEAVCPQSAEDGVASRRDLGSDGLIHRAAGYRYKEPLAVTSFC